MRLLTAGALVRVQLEEPLYRGIDKLVEHRSPKPSAVGSIPTAPANAAIAQSVECILGKDEVTSSNLVSSSIKIFRYRCVWLKAMRIIRFRAFSSPDFFF